MQHHGRELADNVAGRIEIKAEFVPYSWQEVARIQEEFETGRAQGHPTWDDYTTAELCELLSLHEETVRKYARTGELPSLRIGNDRRARGPRAPGRRAA